jgi:hypothetical protein
MRSGSDRAQSWFLIERKHHETFDAVGEDDETAAVARGDFNVRPRRLQFHAADAAGLLRRRA